MRGKRFQSHLPPSRTSITPAGAGKTYTIAISTPVLRDHPRRCGENREEKETAVHELGSPPQVRGKLGHIARLSRNWRITPAGAGKTSFPAKDTAKLQDHPRRCGENLYFSSNPAEIKGSPPQVRGKPIFPKPYPQQYRITPAGAGKTIFFR